MEFVTLSTGNGGIFVGTMFVGTMFVGTMFVGTMFVGMTFWVLFLCGKKGFSGLARRDGYFSKKDRVVYQRREKESSI